MSLGTKNRQNQNADFCKQHLRDKHPDKLILIEEFIAEVEGRSKQRDITKWGQFTDMSGNKATMLERVNSYFEKWLNP